MGDETSPRRLKLLESYQLVSDGDQCSPLYEGTENPHVDGSILSLATL